MRGGQLLDVGTTGDPYTVRAAREAARERSSPPSRPPVTASNVEMLARTDPDQRRHVGVSRPGSYGVRSSERRNLRHDARPGCLLAKRAVARTRRPRSGGRRRRRPAGPLPTIAELVTRFWRRVDPNEPASLGGLGAIHHRVVRKNATSAIPKIAAPSAGQRPAASVCAWARGRARAERRPRTRRSSRSARRDPWRAPAPSPLQSGGCRRRLLQVGEERRHLRSAREGRLARSGTRRAGRRASTGRPGRRPPRPRSARGPRRRACRRGRRLRGPGACSGAVVVRPKSAR